MSRAEADGVGIEYEVTGQGRPVVLLHGFPDSGRLWRHQVPALANAGFQVIVPDLRGYGKSDKPAAVEAYSLLSLAGDVLAVLDSLGIDRAHVVGHDWGAALAWGLASLAPDRVDHLVVELEAGGSLTPGLNWYRANVPPESWTASPIQLPAVSAPTMGIWSTGDFALTETQM